ncbi:MAG: hypothetical protein HY647_07430 [Acidobacteria bacterium]|nr:hypothetical protein [Acidobacteriota bacterium]
MTMRVPIARNPDGSEITGRVRAEYIVNEPASTRNLSSGHFTGMTHISYEAVNPDTVSATLTHRVKETDPRNTVPRSEWAFADCTAVPFPGVPSATKICLKGDFQPDFIYELLYTAKNPLVLGIGFAATRDLVAFFRYAREDDLGTPNPLAGNIRAAITLGISQSGAFLRTFLDLGFNQDERRQIVFEGMNVHIATQRVPLNVRFGQPGRASGQHEDHLFPTREAPFTWTSIRDQVAGRSNGLLERCEKTRTCPKIIHTVSST